MTDINAIEMLSRVKNGENLILLDVREIIEYHTYNVGGTNIPLPFLKERLNELDWNKEDEIIVLCKAGIRSAAAKSILASNGYQNVRNLTGGLLAIQKSQQK